MDRTRRIAAVLTQGEVIIPRTEIDSCERGRRGIQNQDDSAPGSFVLNQTRCRSRRRSKRNNRNLYRNDELLDKNEKITFASNEALSADGVNPASSQKLERQFARFSTKSLRNQESIKDQLESARARLDQIDLTLRSLDFRFLLFVASKNGGPQVVSSKEFCSDEGDYTSNNNLPVSCLGRSNPE